METATVRTGEPTVAVVATAGDGPDLAGAPTAPGSEEASGTIAAFLPEGADGFVVEDVRDLERALDDHRVDCVLVLGPDDGGSARAVVDAVNDHDPDLPVVVAPAEATPDVVLKLAGEPAAHYLPRSTATGRTAGESVERRQDGAEQDASSAGMDWPGAGAVADRIADVVATYDRRRQDARERAMFREVMEMAPLAIYVKDEAGRHLAVSSDAEQAAAGEIVGRTDLELFADGDPEDLDPEEYPQSYRDDLHVLETGEPIEDVEERVELEGGEELWLRTTKVPRYDADGNVVGLLGVTRDVTAEKEREQELERETRRLEQFASFASHDLRNPITIAQGNLELARETGGETADEHLDTVAASLERMEALIDDLLELASSESEHEEDWIPLAEVVERAWTAIESPGAELQLELPADLEVRAASGALRQLLENVLVNAVEHGGSDVTVTVGATPTGFYVDDDGPGIPPEDRGTVFEYGYTTGGSGIGLAIAAEIAAAHGWEPSAGENAAGGARLAFDQCLLRRADAPEPVERDPIELDEWRTVGDPEVPGGAETHGEAGISIRAGGRALWGGIEEYGCYATDVAGGVRIEGCVSRVESIHDYSKAGLLLAAATESGRPLCFVGMTAEQGTETAWRTHPDGPIDTKQAEADADAPRWYRLDRLGDLLTVYASPDGADWRMVDRRTLDLSEPVAVGLAVNSHEVGAACEAGFERVRVVGLEDGA